MITGAAGWCQIPRGLLRWRGGGCSQWDMTRRWWILLAACGLGGCASLQETTVFYTPATAEFFPPWPKDAPVPVLTEPPSWPHRVIGRFVAQSDRGYPFLYKAILYNARLQGADAVVLRQLAFDTRRTYNYLPPSWQTIPVNNVYYAQVQDKKGKWQTVPQNYTTFVPIMQPGRTVVSDVQWTDVTAEMVVRRGKAASAPLPEQMIVPR